MNILEHYIEKICYLAYLRDKNMYQLRLWVDCYGVETMEELFWTKEECEINFERGYYLA